MVSNTKENAGKCSCPRCPSYDECMAGKTEALYCGRDTTSCSVKTNGCICAGCPVYSENNLNSGYYCINKS